ncbi:MAG: SDR family oxidoreductase, partial [Myxococcota bacterium]
ALVTGSAKRVGAAIAIELAKTGFDVAIHFRGSEDSAQETVEACRAHGAEVLLVQADLATVEGCRHVTDTIQSRWDTLNLLVNNASVFPGETFEAIDLEAWQKVLDINLRAPFLLSQGLLPLLREADASPFGAPEGQHGVVVHMVDIGAERPISKHAHYSVSKAGLAMLVKAMAIELAPAVRTCGVSPGQVAWPDHYDDTKRTQLTRRIPLQRVGTPDEVAALVRFLAVEAHYLNGVIVPVDGGLHQRY